MKDTALLCILSSSLALYLFDTKGCQKDKSMQAMLSSQRAMAMTPLLLQYNIVMKRERRKTAPGTHVSCLHQKLCVLYKKNYYKNHVRDSFLKSVSCPPVYDDFNIDLRGGGETFMVGSFGI